MPNGVPANTLTQLSTGFGNFIQTRDSVGGRHRCFPYSPQLLGLGIETHLYLYSHLRFRPTDDFQQATLRASLRVSSSYKLTNPVGATVSSHRS